MKEYVSLRIYSCQSPKEYRDQNFICFNEDDTVNLLKRNYNTGRNRTELPELPFFTYYLKLYCQKFRPKLIMGNAHDCFFVNKAGLPFTEASYSSHISVLFKKHFLVKLTTNYLCICVIGYFSSLSLSADFMSHKLSHWKHSVRTQKRHY